MLTLLTVYYKSEDKLSSFSESVIKQNKEVIQKYNVVRNNNSYVHANEILEKNEAGFVIEVIISILHFINVLDSYNN